ncbi:MAG: ABC transporter transmembrane domain-containing protein, partial [Pseudomonadota bacterium]
MVSLAPIAASALPPAVEAWASDRASARVLAVNETVALTALDGLWLVAAGELDVFAADRLPDGRLGSRRHLTSAKAPAVVSGLALDDGGDRRIEIITVSRGASVLEIAGAALGAPLPDAAGAAFGKLVDAWVEAMTAGLTRDFTPRTATTSTLWIGDTLAVPEGNLASASKGVVWTLVAEGTGKFLGLEAVEKGALLPLSTDSWLTETGGLVLKGFGGGGLVRGDGWWPRLKAFHAIYAACLAASLDKASQLEAWRLERRASTVAEGLDGALGKLARLVGLHDRPPVAHDPDDALAVACAVACKPLGITIEPSPRMNRRRVGDEPLSVEEIARISRVRTRQLALRGTWWREDNGPLVAFCEEDGRPLALVPASPTSYIAHDVVKGERAPLTADLANRLAPMGWTFYTPLPDGKLTVWGLLRHGMMRQKGDLLAAMAAGALGGLLGLAVPVATGLVFQHVIPGHHASQLLQVGLALVMAAAVTTILKITGDVALLRIEGRMAGQLQAGVIDRLLRLPSSFFNAYSTGDLAQRTLMVEA